MSAVDSGAPAPPDDWGGGSGACGAAALAAKGCTDTCELYTKKQFHQEEVERKRRGPTRSIQKEKVWEPKPTEQQDRVGWWWERAITRRLHQIPRFPSQRNSTDIQTPRSTALGVRHEGVHTKQAKTLHREHKGTYTGYKVFA